MLLSYARAAMKSWGWLLPMMIAACGGGSPKAIEVPVANEQDGGASPLVVKPAPPPEDASLPPGANGPTDAVGLIGEAGAILPPNPESLLLVNAAEIRKHPNGEAIRRLVMKSLVGWNMFMPHDIVDPIREVDWALVSGSIFLHHTDRTTFLAHYNLDDARTDAAITLLLKRLAKTSREGPRSFTATVDGARHWYAVPRTGTLLIAPIDKGAEMAARFAKVNVPAGVRPGEIVRLSGDLARSPVAGYFPEEVKTFRLWILPEGDGLSIHFEGECVDEAAAEVALVTGRRRLASFGRSAIVRMVARKLIAPDLVRRTGKTIRYDAVVEGALLLAAADFAGGDGANAPGSP